MEPKSDESITSIPQLPSFIRPNTRITSSLFTRNNYKYWFIELSKKMNGLDQQFEVDKDEKKLMLVAGFEPTIYYGKTL